MFEGPDFYLVRKDRQDGRSRRVLLLIRKEIEFSIISLAECVDLDPRIDFVDIVALDLNMSTCCIHLMVTYVAPESNVPAPIWGALLNALTTIVALAGDFNVHHTGWADDFTDTRGRSLLEATLDHSLSSIKCDTSTRNLNWGRRANNLDILFCSLFAMHNGDSRVMGNSYSSDHFPVILEYGSDVASSCLGFNKFNTGNVNWA